MQQRNNEREAVARKEQARGMSKMKQFQGVQSRVFKQEEEDFQDGEVREAQSSKL